MSGESFGLSRDEVEQYEYVVVTGWPVNFDDLDEQRRQILRHAAAAVKLPPVHYPGSISMPCPACRTQMYLGPRSQEQHRRAPDRTIILCISCLGEQLALAGEAYDMHNLGNTDFHPRSDL